MKTFSLIIAVSLFALGVMGCRTHVPKEQSFAPSHQPKAYAAEHWQQMGRQFCDGVLTNLPAVTNQAIHLAPALIGASDFERAYAKLVKAEMISRAWNVVESFQAAEIHVSTETQLIQHGNRDFLSNPAGVFGLIGYTVVEIFTGQGTGTDRSTSRDLLVTTLVRQGDKPVVALVQIVYVPPGDTELYLGDFDARW